jgi:hypothetical protein
VDEMDRTSDEVIAALVARLQRMPVSDPRARAAILSRVHGRSPSPWRAAFWWLWQPSVPAAALVAVAVVAVGAGYAGRVFVEPASTVVAVEPALPELTLVASSAAAPRLVATQFVLDLPAARRVALVGEFNGWDPEATLLVDPSGRGVWETTVLLPPGRQLYAFVVDDSVWTPDPRAPQVADADFGRANSVAMVAER